MTSPRVVLGVCGGIAAYKVVEVLRRLTETGHDVTVVPTPSALEFVGAPTWAALSGRKVATAVFDDVEEVRHVRLGQEADVVLVAPATADFLARTTHGRADDLLSATLLTARCPVILAPAMHTEMWEHPATRANVALLRSRGVIVLDPDVGRLTGADSGAGRLPEPEALVDAVVDVVRRGGAPQDLAGRHVVVSAGGTREAWDPVRFLGNTSSGRQGVALARTALSRGAQVTLVAAHMDVAPPAGATVMRVRSARELGDAMREASADADVVVMAAAVADFRPAVVGTHKVKRSSVGDVVALDLVQNTDILAALVTARGDRGVPVIVGFAAETGEPGRDLVDLGREKLARKGCDLLVLNDVSEGRVFGEPENEVVILDAAGGATPVARCGKAAVADAIWDAVLARLAP